MKLDQVPPHLRTGSEEQAAVHAVYEKAGCVVYSTSDPRRTRASRGVSDLIVLLPHILLFHESKAGRGVLTPEQKLFGSLVEGRTVFFHWGDAEAAKNWLLTR